MIGDGYTDYEVFKHGLSIHLYIMEKIYLEKM